MAMMVLMNDGKERTENEFKELLRTADFDRFSITKLPFLQAVMEISKS